MTWFAFRGYNSGKAINLAGVQEKEATALAFHGYATEAEAEAKPNTVNALQKAYVNVAIADYKAAVATGSQPGGPNDITTPAGALGALGQSAGNVLGIGSLFQGAVWERAGEMVIGLMLMYTGLKAMVTPQSAGDIAAQGIRQTASRVRTVFRK